MGKLGARLPLGVQVGKEVVRDLAVVEYRFKQEKEIAELVKERNARSMGAHVNAILTVLLSRVGPHDMSKLSKPERQLIINQLYAGDVLYAYCWARQAALGTDLVFSNHVCPFCRREADEVVADLRELEVRQALSAEHYLADVELRDGILYKGETRRKLQMRAPRWEVFDLPENPTSHADLGEITLRCSVVGVEGAEDGEMVYLDDASMESLTKRDYQLMLRTADRLSGGPTLSLSVRCDRCKRPSTRQVNWEFEDFFGTSSR